MSSVLRSTRSTAFVTHLDLPLTQLSLFINDRHRDFDRMTLVWGMMSCRHDNAAVEIVIIGHKLELQN